MADDMSEVVTVLKRIHETLKNIEKGVDGVNFMADAIHSAVSDLGEHRTP